MANKRITDIDSVQTIKDEDYLYIKQDGKFKTVAKSVVDEQTQLKINDTKTELEKEIADSNQRLKDTLDRKVDKTGIKTINGQSILGDGDITISGGSGGGSYTLPVATSTTLGGVKPTSKTAAMTKDVGVDSTGKLYTSPDVTDAEKSTWNGKMDKTTFKTVNGQTITGSGNIEVSSGSNVTVDTALSSTSTNPVQNKVIKAELDKKASTDVATTSADGLMSKEDKAKLNDIAAGANKTIVDSALSDTSTNPVQNKILKAELDKKINSNEIKTINGESIVGDGDITVSGGDGEIVPHEIKLIVDYTTTESASAYTFTKEEYPDLEDLIFVYIVVKQPTDPAKKVWVNCVTNYGHLMPIPSSQQYIISYATVVNGVWIGSGISTDNVACLGAASLAYTVHSAKNLMTPYQKIGFIKIESHTPIFEIGTSIQIYGF